MGLYGQLEIGINLAELGIFPGVSVLHQTEMRSLFMSLLAISPTGTSKTQYCVLNPSSPEPRYSDI